MLRLVILLGLGGIALLYSPEPAAGQEKKEPPKKNEKFPDRITLTRYDTRGDGKYFSPVPDVQAKRIELKVGARFDLPTPLPDGASHIPAQSEILDQIDKSVWIVTKSELGPNGATHICICKKKEEPKK